MAFAQKSKFARRPTGSEVSTDTSFSSSGSIVVNNGPEETLIQKKQRLFKWNNFQNIKIPIDFVK